MKYVLILFTVISVIAFSSKLICAGNGSEACVTHCTEAASANYTEGTDAWSAYFNGCMRTCWMK
ncbi:MAG: hypothetical protein FP816_09640 [Desulfobacteraceae bacterium]|nr:hypothetical protein [Desulfobacteraceae bacterium]